MSRLCYSGLRRYVYCSVFNHCFTVSMKSINSPISNKGFIVVIPILSLVFCLLCVGCQKKTPPTQVLSPIVDFGDTTTLPIHEDHIPDMRIAESSTGMNRINIPDFVPKTDLDTVFRSYRFIPLETAEECLISYINKILFYKNRIYILDLMSNKAYVFDRSGKFVRSLGNAGRGPGEHLFAKDLSIDKAKDKITLLDTGGGKMLFYDLDGKFLQEVPVYYNFSNIEYDGPRMVLNTGRNNNSWIPAIDLYRLVIADRNQEPLARGFKFSDEVRHNLYAEPKIMSTPHGVLYNDWLSDTLWVVNNSMCTPFAVIRKNGKPTFSAEEKAHMTEMVYSNRRLDGEMVADYCISDNYMYISVVGTKEEPNGPYASNSVFYSIQSKKTKRFGYLRNKTTKFGHYLMPQHPDAVVEGDIFCRVLQPSDLISTAAIDYVNTIMTPEEKTMVKGLTLESNPVLMLEELIDF